MKALLFVFLCGVAQARTVKAPPPPPNEDMRVSVPQSQIELKEVKVEPQNDVQYEVSASNWAPTNLSENSYLADASQFHATALPMLSANIWTSGWHSGPLYLAPVLGLSFTQLEREGTLRYSGQGRLVSQNMNLFSTRIGGIVTSARPVLRFIEPYAMVSALPTWASAPESAFGTGVSRTLIALEFAGGLACHIPGVESLLGVQRFALEAGVNSTLGLSNTGYSGFGAVVGTRIGI